MADITLHSGSFCDRNNNEISITFFKRTSTPVMTVDPTALSFTSNGGTKTLTVSGYTGTLSISVTGGSGWLGYTQSTSSGVRTYTFTANANTATSMRNATITLTDSNSTVTVGVTQAGAVSNVTVNPNYLVFNKNGETKTTTVTWTGGSTPTWSNTPEWASITSSVSGNTMTLTINVGQNTTQYQRTGTVYVTNGISRADLALEQEAVHTVSVQPSSFTFPASGGTQVLTISDIQGSFSMNYEGDGLTVMLLDYPSSNSRRYNVTYTPNTVTSTRTGVINVRDTAGGWVAVTTTQEASTDTFAVDPTSFQYGGTGGTNTFTFTGVPDGGLGYDIPSGVDWVTVSNLTNASVDITTTANQSPTSRTAVIKFYDQDDMDNYVTVTLNQSPSTQYYIQWSPYLSSGSFSINSSYYNFSDYSSCYFSDFSGTITRKAFYSTRISTLETNADIIESEAFNICRSLTRASLSNCTYIGYEAFRQCYSLSEIYMPKCTYIGSYGFANCSSVTRVDLPVCSRLENAAFMSCNVSEISLPECSFIGSTAFFQCSINNVYLPKCEYINGRAFVENNMYSVDLPVCSYIGDQAFCGCSNLLTISLGASSVCSIYGESVFSVTSITSSTGYIFVPASLVYAYKSATYWSYFSNIIYPSEGISFIVLPDTIYFGINSSMSTVNLYNVPSGGISDSIYYFTESGGWISVVYNTPSTAAISVTYNGTGYERSAIVTFFDQDNVDNYTNLTVIQDAN